MVQYEQASPNEKDYQSDDMWDAAAGATTESPRRRGSLVRQIQTHLRAASAKAIRSMTMTIAPRISSRAAAARVGDPVGELTGDTKCV
jgi:hypothetical protein